LSRDERTTGGRRSPLFIRVSELHLHVEAKLLRGDRQALTGFTGFTENSDFPE
jgi:hypothetical protein